MSNVFGKTYAKADNIWGKGVQLCFGWIPLKFHYPICSLTVSLVILFQVLWTLIVIDNNIMATVRFNPVKVFSILTATLGFILPLYLNSALKKNRACLDNYRAFVGDIISFSWEIVAFHRINNPETETLISNCFDVLVAIPALSKWHFRGGQDLSKLQTKEGKLFERSVGGSEVKRLIDTININPESKDIDETDACMYKLLDLAKELALVKSKTSGVDSGLIRSWERAYGKWGAMGNLNAYRPPEIFQGVMWTALIIYSVILPFIFVIVDKPGPPAVKNNGYHGLWMVAVVGYFFLGLNYAGSKVGNAFAENAKGFQTVTADQKKATNALIGIWRSRNIVTKPSFVATEGAANQLSFC